MLDGVRKSLFSSVQKQETTTGGSKSHSTPSLSQLLTNIDWAKSDYSEKSAALKDRVNAGGGVMSLGPLKKIRAIFRETFPESSGVGTEKTAKRRAKRGLRQAEASFSSAIADTKGRGCKYTYFESVNKLDALNQRLVTGERPKSAVKTYKDCFQSLQGAINKFHSEIGGTAQMQEYCSTAINQLGLVYDSMDSDSKAVLRNIGQDPESLRTGVSSASLDDIDDDLEIVLPNAEPNYVADLDSKDETTQRKAAYQLYQQAQPGGMQGLKELHGGKVYDVIKGYAASKWADEIFLAFDELSDVEDQDQLKQFCERQLGITYDQQFEFPLGAVGELNADTDDIRPLISELNREDCTLEEAKEAILNGPIQQVFINTIKSDLIGMKMSSAYS